MPSSLEPSWFAVCMSQDKTLVHMRWRPLPDAVQEVLRKAVDRKDTEVNIEAHLEPEDGGAAAEAAPPRYKILLRYWEDQEDDAKRVERSCHGGAAGAAGAVGRFRDAQQINQATSMVRAIRRFRGDADHYLRVVAMAKNIVISTVVDMDEATPKKRMKSAATEKQPSTTVK
jgi:hypothetical protein